MRRTLHVAIVGLALAVSGLAAQTPPQPPLPKGQMPELGRPTKPDDQLPPFNFNEYFIGKWTFEWDVPEGVLGPAGRITGTTIYKAMDGRFYEATTDATGPGGAFKVRELIAYHKEQKALARQVTDSRGFWFLQIGTIGGDLGGYYNIYFESSPFTHGGTSVRIRHAMRLLSPLNYKVATTVSVNGGPFTNYGNPWWRKDVAARGPSPSAFDRRCIPAGCVAPPSNISDIFGRRALPAGRLAGLGATPDLLHGPRASNSR